MRNNREKDPIKLWPSIKYWLANVSQQKSPEQQLVAVNLWYDAFILSDDADDQELRGEITVMRNTLIDLFTILSVVPEEKRREQLKKYLV